MNSQSVETGETSLRIVVLTALYASALAFAIVFSPAGGFVYPEHVAAIAHSQPVTAAR